MPARRIPKLRHHKSSGRAVVTLGGRDVYLGRWGSPEADALYASKIAEWLAAGRIERPRPGSVLTVAELIAQYDAYARSWYVKDGAPTKQLERVRRSLDLVLGLYGEILAQDFSPLKLKTVRQKMIELGWSRVHINHCVGCVKRCWKWAVAEELVPSATFEGLRAVEGLRPGRSAAKESAPVDAVRFTQLLVSAQVAAMIELQLWSGMRPGEVVLIRPADIDRGGIVNLAHGRLELPGVWVYLPARWKTAHHGLRPPILFGPEAQRVLGPYLLREPSAYCFSPAEAEAARRKPAGRGKRRRKKEPGERYTRESYTAAIANAVRRWNERWHPPLCGPIAHWHPHQLRHSAATRLVSRYGWEVARIILGHKSVEMTKVYAADDLAKAAEAVRTAG